MMYNRFFIPMLMAALMTGLSLHFASCSDDKKLSEEEKQQQAEQQTETDLDQAAEFWNVVGQLTDDVMPEDWQHATYAPSIGVPDGSNATVRIVATSDADAAAARFASLTGAKVDGSTQDATYQNDLVGTLKYHRTGGTSLAAVDVDIPQMPELSQIIYKTPEQMGENASFSGTAYYRFGDVVKKLNSDGEYDYWICVRPSFGLAGKGDSHWISVSKIPQANTKTVSKIVKGKTLTHLMHKSLSTNMEHMQNLAEMLYAMLCPGDWAGNLETNDGYKTLKYFNDFNYVRLFEYNNDEFFRNVATGWGDRFVLLFGMTADELRQELQTNGLNLIYGTTTMSGNNILLPMATFRGTNLKTKVLSKNTSTWETQSFNIYDQTVQGYYTFTNATGGTAHAWLIRYATGATLAKGTVETPTYDKYKRLPNCSDVFVYNKNMAHLDMNNLKNINPQTAVRMFTGTGHYKLGQVYKDENGHRWIVVHMSGQGNGVAVDKEATPYCELMSFDGLTASGDHSYVTNLPTFNQAIRGVFRLTNLFTNYILIQDSDLGTQAKLVKNVLDATGVDFRKLFQLVKAVSGNPRNASMHVSVAYRDPAINYAQPLIRYLRLIDLNNENPPYYLRSVYPLYPDKESQTYPAGSFSTTPILLQDVADAAMVARYATDMYAWRPVDTNTGGDGTSNRECRTKADPRALDVTNYYYNQAVWRNYQYPLDMWNSPVLMFRYTAVYDCGDTNFDRKTIDGHTLTFFKESGDLETINNELELSMAIGYLYTLNGAIDMDMFSTSITQLNGVSANMPTWRDAWGQ